jgi:hypothetical protein
MFVVDFAVSVAVGMGLLLALSRLIGRVQFSAGTALRCSFIGHLFTSIVGFFTLMLFTERVTVGVLAAFAIGWVFQTVYFQIAARATGGTLQRSRSALLSALVILGDFFVASPLIEVWDQFLK